jgi:hypothetical protein
VCERFLECGTRLTYSGNRWHSCQEFGPKPDAASNLLSVQMATAVLRTVGCCQHFGMLLSWHRQCHTTTTPERANCVHTHKHRGLLSPVAMCTHVHTRQGARLVLVVHALSSDSACMCGDSGRVKTHRSEVWCRPGGGHGRQWSTLVCVSTAAGLGLGEFMQVRVESCRHTCRCDNRELLQASEYTPQGACMRWYRISSGV